MFWDTVITRADINAYDQDAKIKVRRSYELILSLVAKQLLVLRDICTHLKWVENIN